VPQPSVQGRNICYGVAFTHGGAMKLTLKIIGVLLILAGAVWILQGINILPGSFMTGQIRWAIYGTITAVVGITILFIANRLGKKHSAHQR
jgi:hypothetical protein